MVDTRCPYNIHEYAYILVDGIGFDVQIREIPIQPQMFKELRHMESEPTDNEKGNNISLCRQKEQSTSKRGSQSEQNPCMEDEEVERPCSNKQNEDSRRSDLIGQKGGAEEGREEDAESGDNYLGETNIVNEATARNCQHNNRRDSMQAKEVMYEVDICTAEDSMSRQSLNAIEVVPCTLENIFNEQHNESAGNSDSEGPPPGFEDRKKGKKENKNEKKTPEEKESSDDEGDDDESEAEKTWKLGEALGLKTIDAKKIKDSLVKMRRERKEENKGNKKEEKKKAG